MVWPADDTRVETTLPEELTSQLQNLQLSSGSGSDVADSQLLADAWNFAAKRSSASLVSKCLAWSEELHGCLVRMVALLFSCS